MKPYVVFNSGNAEYRLKIGIRQAIELEDKLGCSIIEGISKLAEMKTLVAFMRASLSTLEHVKSDDDVYSIIDDYLSINRIDDLQDVIFEVLEESGIIQEGSTEKTKKLKAQLLKQAESLSK